MPFWKGGKKERENERKREKEREKEKEESKLCKHFASLLGWQRLIHAIKPLRNLVLQWQNANKCAGIQS